MPHDLRSASVDRTIALCYIRKSWTRDEKDAISPERQRKNIQAVCDAHNWMPEWYQDTEGHRSGMHEKNRPEWLRLKSRLSDADVVALVANDLARLHRKGWRIGDLLEFVDQHGITLVIADPERQLDFSTPQGRMFAQLSAIFDEWYAMDISQRRRADIAHRKSKGVTVGRPPFGTKRDKKTGYLMPSDEGAWLLPDSSWVAGVDGQPAPIEGAVWRGYFQCAHRMLSLYANQKKRGRIWQTLQDEGWAFRDGQGQPAPIEKEDIRRAVSNWAEYGGHVSASKARDRHPSEYPPDEIIAILNPDRAVFDLDLLARVARARQERALGKHPSNGVNRKARAYPLAGITFCAHCEAMAQQNKNPKLRSFLSGHLGIYYRHKPGGSCGCKRKSVQRGAFEDQFMRIIQALQVKPEAVALLNQLALKLNTTSDENTANLEQQKAEAIAVCNRRIQAAIDLYGDGRMSREEYLRRVELNEREIASWQARTTETEKLSMELGMCIQAVEMTKKLWEVSNDEDKQGMVRHLFDYIVFDLDKQCIVDFRLKPWADQFVVSRVALHLEENNEPDNNENPVVLTGYETTGFSLHQVNQWLLKYCGILPYQQPQHRNDIIRFRFASGESLSDLGTIFRLSPQRIFQIVNSKNR